MSDKQICYGLRLTLKNNKEEILTALPEFLEANKIKDYLFPIELENSPNPHLQGYIRTNLKSQTIRDNLKKKMPFIVGNEAYSLKLYYEGSRSKRVDESYRHYCCKGNGDGDFKVLLSSYSEESLNKFNKAWWDVNKVVQEVSKNHKQNLKKQTTEFYQKVYKKIYSQKTLIPGVPYLDEQNTSSCYLKMKITEYFVDNQVIFNKTKFVNTYCYILARVNRDAYRCYIENQTTFI